MLDCPVALTNVPSGASVQLDWFSKAVNEPGKHAGHCERPVEGPNVPGAHDTQAVRPNCGATNPMAQDMQEAAAIDELKDPGWHDEVAEEFVAQYPPAVQLLQADEL